MAIENQNPEQEARDSIDQMLIDAGWVVQNYRDINLGAGRGVALREVPLKTGPCDYLLLVDRTPVGVVEAKKAEHNLRGRLQLMPKVNALVTEGLRTCQIESISRRVDI